MSILSKVDSGEPVRGACRQRQVNLYEVDASLIYSVPVRFTEKTLF